MTNDESPADVAATHAAPPEDEGPRADQPAEPSATPTRRRRTTTPRAPRARKTAAKPAEGAPAEPAAEAPAPPADSALEPVLSLEPEQEPQAKPAPAKAPRKRAPRKKPAATVETEAPVVEAAAEPAPPPDDTTLLPVAEAESPAPEAPAAPARRRRTSRKRTAETAPDAAAATAEVEAPVAEAAPAQMAPPDDATLLPAAEAEAEAPAAPSRRRSSRRRSRKGSAEEAAAPAQAAEVAETAPTTDAEAPTAEPEVRERPSRGRRGGRKRAGATEEAVAPTNGARVVIRRGMPELHIKGVPQTPVLFFGNIEDPNARRRVVSEVQRAAKQGIHLHSTLIEITCPLPPDDSVYELVDSRVDALLEADPQGYVLPRVVFVPAPGWRRQYPDEVAHYADGATGDPSIASERFWQEAEQALEAIVQHCARATYGERVIGYHLERGEWFHPEDSGYDRSFANREAFKSWLRAKYKNNEAALRAAWYDGQVQFYSAEIPSAPEAGQSDRLFFEPRKERRWTDFLEFTSDITADRLIALSKVVKRASDSAALVSVCYGYTFEFGHTFSGHLALGRILAASTIDIVAGPPSYRDRQPGGAGSFPSPVNSMAVHGKLWLSEDDTKTHLATAQDDPDDYNPKMDGRGATEQVHLRAMGKALVDQTAVAWMDLWGDGWLDADDIWQRIGSFADRYREFLKHRSPVSPDVVVLVDERSLVDIQRGPAMVRRLLSEQREMILRAGVSAGFYLQSDLTARNFPQDARLYIFLNPYRLPSEQRAAIKEKLQRGNKTLVWMYGVGIRDGRASAEEGAYEIVGIARRPQAWGTEVGSRVTDTRHPITDQMQNKTVGVRERMNPSFYVDDDEPGIRVLAEYQQTGLPSVAVRRFDNWSSVFCGELTLSPELFKGLCKYAGVHQYIQGGEDYLFAGEGWMTVHSIRDGNRAIRFPKQVCVYDVVERRLVAADTNEFRTFFRGRTTRVLFAGVLDEMRRLGLPDLDDGLARLRREKEERREPEPESAAEPVAEPAPDLFGEPPVEEPWLVGVDAEAEADGDDEADGEDAGAEAAGEGEGTEEQRAANRRRRRRGGRGRGRRRRGPGEGGEPGAEGAPEAAPPPPAE